MRSPSMTIAAFSMTLSARIPLPRTAVVPAGVASWERLRMRVLVIPSRSEGSRRRLPSRHRPDPSPSPRLGMTALLSLRGLPEHRRDRVLVRLRFGVEDEQLLHGVDDRQQLVAAAGALDLEVLNHFLEIGDAH